MAGTGNKKVGVKRESGAQRKASARRNKPKKAAGVNEEMASKNSKQASGAGTASGPREGMIDGLTNKATRIVEQAASILEEEIAAGIVAAKKVEKRYLNVGDLRSGDAEEVMQRFRKDAHEIVDIMLDLVNASVSALGGLTRRAITVSGEFVGQKGGERAASESGIPVLAMPQVLKPGEAGQIAMSVENDSDTTTDEFTFNTVGLLSDAGNQISAKNVEFAPASLTLAPHGLEKIQVKVTVPSGTPAGEYSGLLQATKLSHVQAILTVRVE